MAAEDELPKKLDNMNITPNSPKVKLPDSNLPIELNPFFESVLNDNGEQIEVRNTTSVAIVKALYLNNDCSASQNCDRCRYRTLPSGLLNFVLKKATTSLYSEKNRKMLLRKPVLKALKSCLQPHSNVKRKIFANYSCDSQLNEKGMLNFRDLTDECRNILSEDVDFNGKPNHLYLNNRNLKQFTTIQSTKIKNKSRNKKTLSRSALSLISPETINIDFKLNNAHSISLLQPAILGTSLTSTTLQQRNHNNFLPEQFLNNARCSTSCYQQASNLATSAACDDVNIDELASYFDTFVHIPKKMSSMAEMMYI